MRKVDLLLAMALAVAAGGAVRAEDGEIRQLKALVAEQQKLLSEQNSRMAAQDARMDDILAKISAAKGGTADEAKAVVSIKKNAKITIGGTVNTRYVATFGELESGTAATGRHKVSGYKIANFGITDAKLNFNIAVNDHFDAYLQLDLQHDPNRIQYTAGIAQKYYIRWKNICDTGFGVIIGRNNFIFSDRYNVGQYSGLLGKHDDFGSTFATANVAAYDTAPGGSQGEGMFSHRGNLTPNHVGWDYSRTTQINPYWESADGALRLDLSLMQAAERLTGTSNTVGAQTVGGVGENRSINYGLGSGTFRIMWKPIDGLTVTGSVANFYQNNQHGGATNRWDARRGTSTWAAGHPEWISDNATAANLSLRYNPACAKAWNFWGKWTHGWNDGWTKDLDSDAFNLGASYTFADRWTLFAQGDYFATRNKRDVVQNWYKGSIWALYGGIAYALPYGVNMELAWRHEEYGYKDRTGYKHTKGELDTVYGHIGFDF